MDGSATGHSRGRRLLTRRRLLALSGLGVGGAVLLRAALPSLMRPGPVRAPLGAGAALVRRAFEGLAPAAVWDVHVHLVGLGAAGSGAWVSPLMRSHLHPFRRLQFDLYAAAAGIDPDDPRADDAYVERLLALQRAANPAGRMLLLAFDWHRDASGAPVPERSTFHVPNDWVLELARRHPEVVPCASVHPWRPDALDELERVAAAGARAVKWLPNAMGIDPAAPRCDRFYERLRDLGLPLLSHTGEEQAVEAAEDQQLGNPLRLRRALEAGVRVIAAHCATTGEYGDPDRPGSDRRPAFELLLAMLEDPRWTDRLFADVSATTQLNRAGPSLATLLRRTDLHGRLLFGSDYPLPAVRGLVSTRLLRRRGFLDEDERRACDEVFDANPLLFDLVVKRTLSVDVDGRRVGFAPTVFETARFFGA